MALVSQLPDEVVIACGLRPYRAVDEALRDALQEAGPGAKVLVMPQGGSVLPVPG